MESVSKLLVCGIAGVVFGIVIEKGRVFEPGIIRDQMKFTRFVMLKMFLSAVASSMVSFSLLCMIPATLKHFSNARKAYIQAIATKNLMAGLLGGFLLGAGMALAGSCPGVVLAQVGAGVPNSAITVLGFIFGSVLYGLMEETFLATWFQSRTRQTKHTLDHVMQSVYFVLALPLAALIATVIFSLEIFAPWKMDLANDYYSQGNSLLSASAWPPYVSGCVVGSLQLVVVMVMEDTLGGSSSYCTLSSQLLFNSYLESRIPYLQKYKHGLGNWWQVVYVSGAIIGGWLSSTLSGMRGSVAGVSSAASFLGGLIMIFGSRLAGGCTSGHGVSGIALLMLLSITVVPAMFAGGITTVALLSYFPSL